MRESIFDMIGNCCVPYADEELGLIVVYNGSQTFNVYIDNEDGTYHCVDMWTAGDSVKEMSARELYDYCKRHLEEIEAEHAELG